ncbi:MAG: glycosyltransferase [Candidatus Aenigmarchaeota archaeon]|nr:glycosyltransferase [Candidatus Aenigmarchaeota archaeon]
MITFDKRGGGEKVALALAKAFDADIYTGFVNYESTYEEVRDASVVEIATDMRIRGLRTLVLLHKFGKLVLREYDAYIFSGTNCITANEKNRPCVWYCHTPARHLYDLHDWFMSRAGLTGRVLLKALCRYQKPTDQRHASRFDAIAANSRNVKRRISEYYGTEAGKKTSVVYPPVDTGNFRWAGQGDFYVSMGRLDKLKRVDLIVEAFRNMPEKELKIVSSGPELNAIRKLAQGCENIEVVGYVDEHTLRYLLGRCIASIYVPVHEDFGLSAAESLAAGKPCIAAGEGGLQEIVDNGKTGLLIDATPESIKDAVTALGRKRAGRMRKACETKAKLFSEKRFVKGMKGIVERVCDRGT